VLNCLQRADTCVVIIASCVSCYMYHVHVYTGTVSYCSHYTNQIPEMLYLTMDLVKGYTNHTYDKQLNQWLN